MMDGQAGVDDGWAGWYGMGRLVWMMDGQAGMDDGWAGWCG